MNHNAFKQTVTKYECPNCYAMHDDEHNLMKCTGCEKVMCTSCKSAKDGLCVRCYKDRYILSIQVNGGNLHVLKEDDGCSGNSYFTLCDKIYCRRQLVPIVSSLAATTGSETKKRYIGDITCKLCHKFAYANIRAKEVVKKKDAIDSDTVRDVHRRLLADYVRSKDKQSY